MEKQSEKQTSQLTSLTYETNMPLPRHATHQPLLISAFRYLMIPQERRKAGWVMEVKAR